MSFNILLDIAVTVLCLGAAIGLLAYASCHATPREVMLLLGDSLAPSSRHDQRERDD